MTGQKPGYATYYNNDQYPDDTRIHFDLLDLNLVSNNTITFCPSTTSGMPPGRPHIPERRGVLRSRHLFPGRECPCSSSFGLPQKPPSPGRDTSFATFFPL